jgi:hypothetical protein
MHEKLQELKMRINDVVALDTLSSWGRIRKPFYPLVELLHVDGG